MLIRLTDQFVSDLGDSDENADAMMSYHEGQSQVRYELDHYVYRNPRNVGGRSTTGMEIVFPSEAPGIAGGGHIGVQPGFDFKFFMKNSDIRDSIGAGIQMWAEGSDSGQFEATIRDSKFSNGGPGFQLVHNGASTNDSWKVDIQDTEVIDSTSHGVEIRNRAAELALDMRLKNTVLSGAASSAFRIENGPGATMQSLLVNASCSEFSGSPTGLSLIGPGQPTDSTIDFGGGAAGSPGYNKISDNTRSALVNNFAVVAENNWWGSPSGPIAELLGTGTLDSSPLLEREPTGQRGCPPGR
jgi:hypothetical protein